MRYSAVTRAAEIILSEDKRTAPEGQVRATKTAQRKHFRARVILKLAQGLSNQEVARRFQALAAPARQLRVFPSSPDSLHRPYVRPSI
jgi:hypothetical protein